MTMKIRIHLVTGDTAEVAPDCAHLAASAPALASMPASTAAYEAANLATPSVLQLVGDSLEIDARFR